MKFSARLRKGFTLIELLIVIVIIGILAVGLVPKVIDAPKKARDTVRKTDLNQIKIALESYYADKNSYPACGANPCDLNAADLGLAAYFQGGASVPKPPSTGNYFYIQYTGCYVLGTTMESANAGNANEAAPSTTIATGCSVASKLPAGAGKTYYIAGGSF